MANSGSADMCDFFHSLLFAYQKSVKEILGPGEAAFMPPILEKIILVTNKQNLGLPEEQNPEELLEDFLEELLKKGTAKWVELKEVGEENYLFRVEGCRFSKHIHGFADTEDTTCPLALAVMAYLQVSTGKKVRPTDSKYTKTGTRTLIEFLPQQKKKIAAVHASS
ncbi:MAG: hypothetical protein NWF06_00855 [Candidatus Bathyarchaeota archaeon]|nr:hypothetical protein [Candidatus Bathyarchaeum sp.]